MHAAGVWSLGRGNEQNPARNPANPHLYRVLGFTAVEWRVGAFLYTNSIPVVAGAPTACLLFVGPACARNKYQ